MKISQESDGHYYIATAYISAENVSYTCQWYHEASYPDTSGKHGVNDLWWDQAVPPQYITKEIRFKGRKRQTLSKWNRSEHSLMGSAGAGLLKTTVSAVAVYLCAFADGTQFLWPNP